MKKFLTLLLSMLVLFTSVSLKTYAATGPGLAEKGQGMNVTVAASQNDNGDLVISVSGEQKEEFISLVMSEHKTTITNDSYNHGYGGGNIVITDSTTSRTVYFYNGQVYNSSGEKLSDEQCNNDYNCKMANKKQIIREGDNLKILKEDILEDFNISSNTLHLLFWNEDSDAKYNRLLDYEVKADVLFNGSPIAKKFNLVGYFIDGPYVGAPTNVDLSNAYLQDEDGTKIYPKNSSNSSFDCYFDFYWADTRGTDLDEIPEKTSDETFASGKEYIPVFLLKYLSDDNYRIFVYCNSLNSGQTFNYELYKNNSSEDYNWIESNRLTTAYAFSDYGFQNMRAIATGSDYLSNVFISDEIKDATDEEMINNFISVAEYLITNNKNIDATTVSKFKEEAEKSGNTLDDIFSFKIMKNTVYGYYNDPLKGREISDLGHDAEITFPMRNEIINTDPKIKREYKILTEENGDFKTIDVLFPSYIEEINTASDAWYASSFNINKSSIYALIYKDTKVEEDEPETKAPVITKGDSQNITVGDKKELSFTSDALYQDFKEVKLNDETLDSKYYTVSSGSTIVTLNADYVSNLKEGTYKLSIVSSNGTATAKFTVSKKEATPTPSPEPTPSADTKKEETTKTDSKSYSSKDKNQDGIITCDEEMNSKNWVWSETKKACVYRVSNTSAK